MYVKAVKSLGGYRIEALDLEPRGVRALVTTYVYTGGDEGLVVDPGPASSAKPLIGYLASHGVKKLYIFLTHIHLDHAGASGLLAESFKTSRIYVHPRGARHLVEPSKLWKAAKQVLGEMAYLYEEPYPVKNENIVETTDYMELELLGRTFRFIYTPGHASHHQSILDVDGKILFSGDSLGMWIAEINSYIPSTPPPFKYELYMDSLKKMARENPEMVYFPHTAPLYAAGIFEQHRKQLIEWMDVIQSLLGNSGAVLDAQQVVDELLLRDGNVDRIIKKGNKYHRMLLYSTINGLIAYLKNMGSTGGTA